MGPLAIALGLAELVGPQIVKWVAGDKAGAVAEEVVSTATALTGKAAPEALRALQEDRELQAQFKKALLSHEKELEDMYLQDRQDARRRDLELHKAGYRNTRADVMIGIAFTALVAIIALLTYMGVAGAPEGSDKVILQSVISILSTAVGWLLKMLSDAFQFEFGSSRGSKEKDVSNAISQANLQEKLLRFSKQKS